VAGMVDVMPAVLDLAGVPVPDAVQGKSLASLVAGAGQALVSDAVDNVAFVETGNMIGIRTPTHLYGMRYDAEKRLPLDEGPWLYDLVEDPLELRNLAGEQDVAELEQQLKERLLAWDAATPYLPVAEH